MVSNKRTQLQAGNAGNIARAAWIMVEMSLLHSSGNGSGKVPLHDLIDPATGNIKTRLPIQIDPYTFLVYLSSAVRMGLCVCGTEATFHPSISTVKWFADNGEKVRQQGLTNTLLSDLFKHIAEVV